ncbi:hypothetical protein jhhlp_005358 [Lomentospora prolificans]|uniref:Uncharacterized protein n=1 Tax=Lomentospora prolificans TaxID=41688 RepID=A0A2N3N6K5_9PEZI|nr:hypothetical protein jhhlp_005358 [Lomentospora prolificans]
MEKGMEIAKQDTIDASALAKSLVPDDRLLIVKLEDGLGWDEICPFLGHPIPDTPYPRGNAPGEFKKLIEGLFLPRIKRALGILASGIIVPVLSVGLWYYLR